jgi:CIC family chloride channel protein
MISFVHNLFFLGIVSIHYDSSQFTPSNPWGAAVILVPVVGTVIVTFIVSNFAPEAKGHGVPEVMDAIYYKGGVIRPAVAAVKSVASAVAIGSGAAVGREGLVVDLPNKRAIPRSHQIRGVITKEHVAGSVAKTVSIALAN